MFKKIKSLFSSKRNYVPSVTVHKLSQDDENLRRPSFKALDLSEQDYLGNNSPISKDEDKFSMEDIEFIWPIPEDRYEEVILYLRNNFFADEPLIQSLGLCEPGQPHTGLEVDSLNLLQGNLSVMAIDKHNGQIVAVSLNGILLPDDIQKNKAKLDMMTDEKTKTLFGLLNQINEQVDIFKQFQVEKLFDVRILSVKLNYRGKGLGKEIMQRTEEVAKQNGCMVMKADATGISLQMLLKPTGWKVVHELEYVDLVSDHNGQEIFKTKPPGNSLQIMVKHLDKSESEKIHSNAHLESEEIYKDCI